MNVSRIRIIAMNSIYSKRGDTVALRLGQRTVARETMSLVLHLHPRWQLLRPALVCSTVERKNLVTM